MKEQHLRNIIILSISSINLRVKGRYLSSGRHCWSALSLRLRCTLVSRDRGAGSADQRATAIL